MAAMAAVIMGGDVVDAKQAQVSKDNFETALSNMRPRISAETVAFYERYISESGLRVI